MRMPAESSIVDFELEHLSPPTNPRYNPESLAQVPSPVSRSQSLRLRGSSVPVPRTSRRNSSRRSRLSQTAIEAIGEVLRTILAITADATRAPLSRPGVLPLPPFDSQPRVRLAGHRITGRSDCRC